jgi:hemerythrin-like domain-containing protein
VADEAGEAEKIERSATMIEGQPKTEEAIREQIRAAVEAIDGALQGIVRFLTPLRPTMRNELIQFLGGHVEQARHAKESLEKILLELQRQKES